MSYHWRFFSSIQRFLMNPSPLTIFHLLLICKICCFSSQLRAFQNHFKKNNQMQFNQVRSEMAKLDIGFTPNTIHQVQNFLKDHIGVRCLQNPRYYVAAAAAIVSQATKMGTVGNTQKKVSSGIKIENIMKRLKDLSKDIFLDTINLLVEKYTTSEHHLKEKIPKIRLSYRSFKKYKNIFEQLYKKAKLPENITSDLQSFFWIIFLLIKIKSSAIEDIQQSTKILIVLIQQIFTQFYSKTEIEIVNEVIYRSDNFGSAPPISKHQTHYREQIMTQIRQFYAERSSHSQTCFQTLLHDEILLSRLVDDLSQSYDRIFIKLPQGRYIDEITFLGLQKNLTPKPFSKKIETQQSMICKRINFGDDDDEDDKNTTERKSSEKFSEMEEEITPVNLLSNFNKEKEQNIIQKTETIQQQPKIAMTPLSLGIAKNLWVKECMKKIGKKQEIEMQDILQKSGKSTEDIKYSISKCINQILPYLKKDHCLEQIYKLTVYLTIQIEKESKKSSQQMKVNSYINVIVGLASCLYFYSIRCLNIEFKNYCNIYNFGLVEGFQVIYFVGSKLNVHNVIRQYLYQLEKLILIKQFWDSDLGYELLCQRKLQFQSILTQRLHRHIEERIKEICSKIGVLKTVEQEKILDLVVTILSQKYELLQGNKLDQIIVCSITSCLTFNQSKYQAAISQIFNHYNQTSNSFHSIQQGLHFKEGKMNLIDFYNSVFLPEIEMMVRQTNKASFIFTPIREQNLKKTKGNTPLPPICQFSSFGKPIFSKGNNYQKDKKSYIYDLLEVDGQEGSPRHHPSAKRRNILKEV